MNTTRDKILFFANIYGGPILIGFGTNFLVGLGSFCLVWVVYMMLSKIHKEILDNFSEE
jgi:hypothetical protein